MRRRICAGQHQEASGGSDFVGTFEPYGQLRTHLAAYNDTAEVQDNATRVGINFRTRGAIKMFAGTEWGVNLVQSATQFNLSASGPGDFGVVETETNPVFTARLGFVGVDFGPLGRVAIGKQTAVHYDVTSYTTDRFNVFGGQGTSTYVAGTDGGASGTGFADRVVNYRNTIFKILEVGFQGQFRGPDSNGVGGSLQLTILPGVKIGGAVTHTNWSPTTQNLVRGLGGDADYVAVGYSHRLAGSGTGARLLSSGERRHGAGPDRDCEHSRGIRCGRRRIVCARRVRTDRPDWRLYVPGTGRHWTRCSIPTSKPGI